MKPAPREGLTVLGRGADWTCLFGPPLLTAALVVPAVLSPGPAGLLVVLFAAFPGLAHVLSTGVLYLDASNREIFRQRRGTFYVAPVLLTLMAGLLAWSSPRWLLPALLTAAVYHNTRQSLGILALMRRRGAPGQAGLKRREEVLVWAVNVACLLGARALLPAGALPTQVPAVAWGVALVTLGLYVHRLLAGPGPRPSGVHLAFLGVSATLSWPVLVVGEPLLAWALMSFPHQMQYMGLFWTCARRRYLDRERAFAAHPLLRVMAADLAAGFTLLAGAGFALRFLETTSLGPLTVVATGAVMAATFCHYWLDAFVWRGRDPEMRALLVEYLEERGRPGRGAVAVA